MSNAAAAIAASEPLHGRFEPFGFQHTLYNVTFRAAGNGQRQYGGGGIRQFVDVPVDRLAWPEMMVKPGTDAATAARRRGRAHCALLHFDTGRHKLVKAGDEIICDHARTLSRLRQRL